MDLCIKMICVDGFYKALVLDLSKVSNRLVCLVEGPNQDMCWNEAQDLINELKGGVTWH